MRKILVSLILLASVAPAAAQDAPPATICDGEGACILADDLHQPYTITCDKHAGMGSCPAVPTPSVPNYTG